MQHAVKLALVDPRHIEYRDIGKEPDRVNKADISLQLREILTDDRVPDDLKIKLYRQGLGRFMTAAKKQIEEEEVPTLPPVSRKKRRGKAVTSSYKNKRKKGDTVITSRGREVRPPVRWLEWE